MLSTASIPTLDQGEVELGRVLGRGGAGVVYKGRWARTNEDVAVKEILLGSRRGAADRAAAEREAAQLARLRHHHIVQLRGHYDVRGAARSSYNIVMEYCGGGTLQEALFARREAGRPPWGALEQIRLARHVAEAMRYAHDACSTLHRDLKSANVLLTAAGPGGGAGDAKVCLLYTSPSPRDKRQSRMPSSA